MLQMDESDLPRRKERKPRSDRGQKRKRYVLKVRGFRKRCADARKTLDEAQRPVKEYEPKKTRQEYRNEERLQQVPENRHCERCDMVKVKSNLWPRIRNCKLICRKCFNALMKELIPKRLEAFRKREFILYCELLGTDLSLRCETKLFASGCKCVDCTLEYFDTINDVAIARPPS